MNAQQIIAKLAWVEVDGTVDPDCREVIEKERYALSSAVQSKNAARIEAATKEAVRVAKLWGVSLA